MLTFRLAFPGVVIGFMVILLAGRQGVIAEISLLLGGERIVFAYSIAGLFLGYLYFSIRRCRRPHGLSGRNPGMSCAT